jgi:hypothetical protein
MQHAAMKWVMVFGLTVPFVGFDPHVGHPSCF